MISGGGYFLEHSKSSHLRYISFTNSTIIYHYPRKEIKLENIRNIKRTCSIKYERYSGVLYNKISIAFMFFLFFLIAIYGLISHNYERVLFVFLGIFFCIFFPKFWLHFRNGGSIMSYKFFDAVVVSDGSDFINILPNSPKEREALREYFLDKKKVDITELRKTLYII